MYNGTVQHNASEAPASELDLTQQAAGTRKLSGAASRRRTVMQVTWSLVAGGAEMYALTIASGLDAGRYKSMMCGVDKGGALEGEIKQKAIPYFIMDRRPGIDLKLMWRLYRLFRRHKVDIVQTHHFNQLFYSAIGARLAGARIIHTEHCLEDFKRPPLQRALRLLATLCHKVIAIGDDVARGLRDEAGIPGRKIETIRAGVDLSAFDQSKSEARGDLGLGEGDRVALIVARLFPEKNHKLLLQAFQEVARRIEGARLLIAGDGIEEDAIRDEIKRLGLGGSVKMLGVRRDVARLLAASDVFVLSSDREGLPIAVLEAMAAAKPVVATAVGDIPTIIIDGETGRLVPALDKARLADALIDMFSDAERAAGMGRSARRLVDESYSMRSMIEKYDSLFVER